MTICQPPQTFDEPELKGIACRSVHLGYPAPVGVAFYNEVTIEQSAAGTYFMVCGWDKGYFGMQELGNGHHILVWPRRSSVTVAPQFEKGDGVAPASERVDIAIPAA